MEILLKLMFFILVAGFFMKLLSNFITPYDMGIRLIVSKKEEIRSPSLMLFVEWGLLIVLFLCSLGITNDYWLYQSKTILAVGISAILFSYVHFVVVMFILCAVANRLAAKREKENSKRE